MGRPVKGAARGHAQEGEGMTTEESDYLMALAQAIHKQADAIDRLASATEALITALADQQDPDIPTMTYLDGKPVT
jgi:ABC-type transporter Mla subunit MlaD